MPRFRDADGEVRTVSTGCKDEPPPASPRRAGPPRRTHQGRRHTRREADAADRMHDPIDRHIADYMRPSSRQARRAATPMHRDNTGVLLSSCRRLPDGRALPIWPQTASSLDRQRVGEVRPGRQGRSTGTRSRRRLRQFGHRPRCRRLPETVGSGWSVAKKVDDHADLAGAAAPPPDELARLVAASRNAPERLARQGEEDVQTSGDPPNAFRTRQGRPLDVPRRDRTRVGEVKQLTVADVRLDAVPPHVRVPAAVAKSRKEQTVPLRSDLIVLMRAARRVQADRSRLRIPAALIRRFDADCRRAGIPKRTRKIARSISTACGRRSAPTWRYPASRRASRWSDAAFRDRTDHEGLHRSPALTLAAAIEATSSVVTKVVTPSGSQEHLRAFPGTDDQDEGKAMTWRKS